MGKVGADPHLRRAAPCRSRLSVTVRRQLKHTVGITIDSGVIISRYSVGNNLEWIGM